MTFGGIQRAHWDFQGFVGISKVPRWFGGSRSYEESFCLDLRICLVFGGFLEIRAALKDVFGDFLGGLICS